MADLTEKPKDGLTSDDGAIIRCRNRANHEDIMGAQPWINNSDLIKAVAESYLTRDMLTLDTTHGKGVFWRRWCPDHLVRMAHPSASDDSWGDMYGDFMRLPFADNTYDLTVFDPPYMPKGTPGALADMDAHYGVGKTSRKLILELGMTGIFEAMRVTKPGGIILHKSGRGQDGGKLFRGDDWVVRSFELATGCEVLAQYRFIRTPQSQKHRGVQQGPRSNYSTLTVIRVPKKLPVMHRMAVVDENGQAVGAPIMVADPQLDAMLDLVPEFYRRDPRMDGLFPALPGGDSLWPRTKSRRKKQSRKRT